MSARDRRITPARADLAAERLRGLVEASRYVQGEARSVVTGICPVRREPRPDAPLDSEALFGERVTVYEESNGWAWAQLERDAYVGYLPVDCLGPVGASPTHRVAVPRTFLFPGPSIKLPPRDTFGLGTELSVTRIEGELAQLAGGGFVPACHIGPLDFAEPDYVAVARRFLGTPYLWGGRTALGLDCSGLVQTALDAAGIEAPRDSDMQEAELGQAVTDIGRDGSGLRRGDLLFWKGHVAIALGGGEMVHATAYRMAVIEEKVAPALQRIEKAGYPLRSVKRP